MTMLVEEYVGRFEVPVDDVSQMHVLQAQNDLGCVEFHLVLGEDAVLGQVVVQVAAIHQVQDEAELVVRVKCVGHANDERRPIL